MRRRVDRHAAARTWPAASSSSARAGCATSSSPSSCCSSCTAGPTSRCASPATLAALAALADGGYVGRADADAWPAPTASCAVEHRLQLYQLRRTHTLPRTPTALRWLGRAHWATAATPVRDAARASTRWRRTRARSAACTRSCSTGRCWTRSRGCPRERGAADPGGGAATGWRRSASRDPAGALRHIEALTVGVTPPRGDPAARCCR